jgi:DNA modification methylase
MQVRDRVKELRRVRADTLIPNARNWRRHPQAQADALRGALAEIGYADALLVRETPDGLQLIDGHLRAETTPDMEVPVLVLDVDEAEADKLLATLDPLAAMAVPDAAALEALLAEVTVSSEALQAMLDDLAKSANIGPAPGLTDPDAVPEPPEPISKTGDLWLCGDHRLLCGDSTKVEDVERLMAGETPFLCVTDPPYGVNYDPSWRNVEAAKGNLAYAANRVGPVTNDDRADWSAAWALFPGDVIYSWHPPGATSLVHAAALQDSGFTIRMQIIWAKSNFPIGRGDYHVRHEPCWYAVREGKPSRRTDDRTQTTLWEINLDKNVEGGHSTQKPCECMERPIRNHDAPSVYDPFLGSGTTMIAGERLRRRCYGMEIEPRYVDVAVKRWEQFTGREAQRG